MYIILCDITLYDTIMVLACPRSINKYIKNYFLVLVTKMS